MCTPCWNFQCKYTAQSIYTIKWHRIVHKYTHWNAPLIWTMANEGNVFGKPVWSQALFFLAIVIVASSGTYMTQCRFKAWIDAFLSTVLVAVKSFSAPCLGSVSGVRWALEHFQTCTSPAAIRLTGYVSRKTSTAVLWNVINKNWFKLRNSIRELIRLIIF